MKMLTIEDCYKKLGFQDPWMFAVQRMRDNLGDDRIAMVGPERCIEEVERGTGRSTRRAINVIVQCQDGTILRCPVVGSKTMRKHFADMLRELSYKLGLDCGITKEWSEIHVKIGKGKAIVT